MRLLLVNSAAPELWGGGEKWFVEAADWFSKQGHVVTLVARPDSQLAQRALERGIDLRLSRFGGDFDPAAILSARALLRETSADVVLTNFNKEAWQFGLAAKLTSVRVVARHGFTLWSNTLRHRVLANQLLAQVIVNSDSILERYRQLGFVLRRASVVYNGVASVEQKRVKLRTELACKPNELLLAAAGRLESQKRFDRLLRCVAEISKSKRVKLALFGQGPHERELREQARALQIEDVVRFMGFRDDFASVVGDADLFLLTSDSEGSPNVVLEAMSAGVPVLGFAVGAMPQLLRGDLQSYLVAPGDEEEFVRRLAGLAAAVDTLTAARKTFEQRVRSEFSLDDSMRRYEEILTATGTRI
ncbi:MAG: glycosyltransferase [bacterium]|nr:glycosyltransferase [bacterium]